MKIFTCCWLFISSLEMELGNSMTFFGWTRVSPDVPSLGWTRFPVESPGVWFPVGGRAGGPDSSTASIDSEKNAFKLKVS